MKSKKNLLLLSTLSTLAFASASHAELVTNWSETGSVGGLQGTSGTTASPVVGNGTTDNHAGASNLYASIGGGAGYILSEVGDVITLTGSVSFTGNITNASSGAFRFGLFDVNGSGNLEGWLGYFTQSHNGSTTAKIYERKDSNTTAYASTTTPGSNIGEELTGVAPGTAWTATDVSAFSLSLELLANNNVRATSQLLHNGTDFAQATGTFLASVNGSSLTFNRVGFLVTNALSADQASFSNIDVTFAAIPEPGTYALLAGLGALGVAVWVRRKRSRAS
jgi:hypothetical protein